MVLNRTALVMGSALLLSSCKEGQAAKVVTALGECWQSIMRADLLSCADEQCQDGVKKKYELACQEHPADCEQIFNETPANIAGPPK